MRRQARSIWRGADVAAAVVAERQAQAARDSARAAAEAAEAASRSADEFAAGIAGRLASVRGQVEALAARRREDESRGLARRARRGGGRRLDDGVAVDPELRAAVEAVLGDAANGWLVPSEVVPGLAGERGVAVPETGARGAAAQTGVSAVAGGTGAALRARPDRPLRSEPSPSSSVASPISAAPACSTRCVPIRRGPSGASLPNPSGCRISRR